MKTECRWQTVLIMAVVLLCGLTQSQAGNSIWTNTAGGNWNTPANWHPNGVPATGNTVFITNSGNYTVTINSTASIADLVLGHTHATGTQRLALTGGTFAITNLTSASNSVISVTAGTLVTAGGAQLLGEVNQASGTWHLLAPSSVNTYHLTNGELRGANVIITNFLWLGGDLNAENAASNTVTIPPGGTLTLAGATAKRLSGYTGGQGRRLVHQGTGTWSGAGIAGFHGAQFLNQGHLTLTSEVIFAYGGGTGTPRFQNTGTLLLPSGSAFTLNSAFFDNQAQVTLTDAALTVGPGSIGTNTGTLHLDAASTFLFSGATLHLGGAVVAPAVNSLQLAGATAYIATTNLQTPTLWQQGGTVYQTTNVVIPTFNHQAGALYATLPVAFATYHLTNGELRGANVIITNFLWLGGDLNAENAASNTVTIPPGGTLTLAGATAKRLSGYTGGQGRRLVHQGTGTWSGAGIAGFHGAQFLNQGHLTLTSDAGLAYGGGTGAPVFHNQGTFSKTDGAGVAAFSSTLFTNAGTLNIARGGITIGGVFHQTAGNANLGTNFTAHSDVRIDAGSFTGRGSVAGTFYNNGVSSAGSPLGLMTGTSWTNSATGTIRFEIGGTNPGSNFDQFRFSGPAQIGGSADLALANGFVPSPGNTFTTVLASVRSGTFSNLTFSGGYQFSALYTPHERGVPGGERPPNRRPGFPGRPHATRVQPVPVAGHGQ